MPLFYRAVQSPMANKAGAKLWHLNLVKTGATVTTQQLAEVIAEKSSLTPGDVQKLFPHRRHQVAYHILHITRRKG